MTSPPNKHDYGRPARISGQYADILFSFFVAAMLMTIFSAVLLGMVFHHRVQRNSEVSPRLRDGASESNDSSVVFVNLNATLLIFIASWSSSLAPSLAGFMVSLATYPVAGDYLRILRQGDPRKLLTPYQLALTLRFTSGGGLSALWQWILYMLGWNSSRQRQARPLRAVSSIFCVALFLSVLVLVADTWLHVTTRTVNFTQLTPAPRGTRADRFGFGLRPQCTSKNNSYVSEWTDACSLNKAATNTFLINPTESLQAINNVSSRVVIQMIDGSARSAGSDGDRGAPFAYMAPPSSPAHDRTDYSAPTFALQTHCRPVSSECNLTAAYGASTPFNCGALLPSFAGDVTQKDWIFSTFSDATGASNMTIYGVENPFYFGIAALVNIQGYGVDGATTGMGSTRGNARDTGWVTPVHGGKSFVLLCNTTAYDVELTRVNGSVTRFAPATANLSLANIVNGIVEFTPTGRTALQQAASVGAIGNSSRALADHMAQAFSRIALAAAAGTVEPRVVHEAQRRRALLVARVPLAPLAALVGANMLLALLGVVLAVVALLTAALRRDAVEVQARLSVAGLVADRFGGTRAREPAREVEELFAEKVGRDDVRVGIDRSEEAGGWEYKVWQSDPTALLHYS